MQQASESNKKGTDSDLENKLMLTVGGEGRSNTGTRDQAIQTIEEAQGCIYCTTEGIQPIFCNNCKWKVIFQNCIKNKVNEIVY